LQVDNDDDDNEDEDEDDTNTSQPLTATSEPQSPPIDFELVSEQDVSAAMDTMKQQQQGPGQQWRGEQLREGFVWQKQLVFRSKLTMHTAFERKDNKEPAAVTCISVAK
jgi:hypothetical protein